MQILPLNTHFTGRILLECASFSVPLSKYLISPKLLFHGPVFQEGFFYIPFKSVFVWTYVTRFIGHTVEDLVSRHTGLLRTLSRAVRCMFMKRP